MRNRIELVLEKGLWMAKFIGPHAEGVLGLFGTNTIPTPFTEKANRARVLVDITDRNPQAFVSFAEVKANA